MCDQWFQKRGRLAQWSHTCLLLCIPRWHTQRRMANKLNFGGAIHDLCLSVVTLGESATNFKHDSCSTRAFDWEYIGIASTDLYTNYVLYWSYIWHKQSCSFWCVGSNALHPATKVESIGNPFKGPWITEEELGLTTSVRNICSWNLNRSKNCNDNRLEISSKVLNLRNARHSY